MRGEALVAALVAIVAISGLVLFSQGGLSGAATNPGLKCDGHWTYLYGVEDGGGLQCVETTVGPKGGSYAGGGELGSWPQPKAIRKKGPSKGLSAREIEELRGRTQITFDYNRQTNK